jgi:hypothetical protein
MELLYQVTHSFLLVFSAISFLILEILLLSGKLKNSHFCQCSPRATFNISKVTVALFPSFKAKFDTRFFKSRFQCTPKLQREQPTQT